MTLTEAIKVLRDALEKIRDYAIVDARHVAQAALAATSSTEAPVELPTPEYKWSDDGKTVTFVNHYECVRAALAQRTTAAESAKVLGLSDKQFDNFFDKAVAEMLDAHSGKVEAEASPAWHEKFLSWCPECHARESTPQPPAQVVAEGLTDAQRLDHLEAWSATNRERGFHWNNWSFDVKTTVRAQLDAAILATKEQPK